MKRSTGLGLLIISGTAIACAIGAIVTAPVQVSAFQSIADHWESIGDQLEDQLGSSGENMELTVKIPVQVCVGSACAPPVETNMFKPCGETLKEAAYSVASNATGGGDGGGGGDYGGGGSGSNPFDGCFPGTDTVEACTSAGGGQPLCTTQNIPVLECPGMT